MSYVGDWQFCRNNWERQRWICWNAGEFGSGVGAESSGDEDSLKLEGRFVMEHWRDGKKIAEYPFHNLVTNEGKNRMFNTMFKGTAQLTTWYVGLISNVSYTAPGRRRRLRRHRPDGGRLERVHRLQRRCQQPERYDPPRGGGGLGVCPGDHQRHSGCLRHYVPGRSSLSGAFICGGADGRRRRATTRPAAACLWSEGLFPPATTWPTLAIS